MLSLKEAKNTVYSFALLLDVSIQVCLWSLLLRLCFQFV